VSSPAAFQYLASRKDGTLEIGTIEATSESAANSQLIDQGLFPVEVQKATRTEEKQRVISAEDLALGLRMLASFLEAGLPVNRALAALVDVVPPSWLPILDHVREEVRQGSPLGGALHSCPVRIAPLVVGIIQAGEAGSGLVTAVKRSADIVDASVATRRAITAALAYPIILAIAGSASLALLVGIVLPRFAAILADIGQTLPPATRVVLGMSTAFRFSFFPLLAFVTLALLVWRAWVNSEQGLMRWHGVLLDIPVLGPIRASVATARIALSLAALLDAGVPLVQALAHVGRAGGDSAMSARILAARASILHGEGVAHALGRENAFTPTALKLIRAGEETGKLSELLARASQIEDERARLRIQSLVRVIEPLLIIGFGLLVAVVAAALLQAVYSVKPT